MFFNFKNTPSLVAFICTVLFSISCSSLEKPADTPTGKKVVQKTIAINATKDVVWSALTDNRELDQWWGKGVKLEPNIGGAFYEPWGDGQLATGKVLALTPLEFIEFTWKEKTWNPNEKTTCKFSLEETNGKTILTVTHTGWESFPLQNQDDLVKGFQSGWNFILPKIKVYIEGK